ncbi:hypothetical protein [Aeromonas bivalvium]|uniref:hypothetical protein n=1 Tax=Aeromonas bivalvium TaxID=440079 RepID=UPI003D24C7E9
MEKHKEGMSARKIAELFGLNNKTVSSVIDELSKNASLAKLLTPEGSTSTDPDGIH